MSDKRLRLRIDSLLEKFSADNDHYLETTEEEKETFLDWFARKWRKLAEKSLEEVEEE